MNSTQSGRLGERLAAELRAELGRQNHSRRWLAEKIGHSHNTVARWLAGDTNPCIDNVDEMCQALGISLESLLAAIRAAERGEVIPHPRRRSSDHLSLLAM